MEKLPTEMSSNIFSRLPFESVLQCKCVSKSWCNLLELFIHSSDLYFAKLHGRRLLDSSSFPDSLLLMLDQSVDNTDNNKTCDGELHYAEYNEDENGFNCKVMKKFNCPLNMNSKFWTMASSSNGLICSVNDDDSYLLYIYNPFLGEYVTLPNSDDDQSSMAFGFGHIPSTDEYKVVRIAYPPPGDGDGNVEVYTLGKSNHWRSKGSIKHRLQVSSPGVLVNGSLHWLMEKKDQNKKPNVVVFNLLEEKFHEIPLPRGLQTNTNFKMKELEGCLCGIDYTKEGRRMLMWKFMEDYYLKNKEEGKEKEYWKNIFGIQHTVDFKPKTEIQKECH